MELKGIALSLPILLHTSIGIEKTIAFLKSTEIATRKWHLQRREVKKEPKREREKKVRKKKREMKKRERKRLVEPGLPPFSYVISFVLLL